jgi:PEP-CTERM motif-containing protein
MKRTIILSLTCVLVAVTQAPAQIITGWTFENNPVAVNNSPAPSMGTGTASSLGMNIYPTPNIGVATDDVLVGKSSDTGANLVADTTQTWRVRAQAGSSGAANGWSSAAPIGTQGAEFATSTVGYNSINVSFDWYATTQGEANMQLEYTTDGTTWHNVALTLSGSDAGLQVLSNGGPDVNTVTGSYVSDNILTGGSSAGQDWFTGLTAAITDPNAANNPSFAIEMVNASTGADNVSTQGTALNNSSGNWRFDNVVISGALAVPEPSTFALIGCGFAALIGLRRKSR